MRYYFPKPQSDWREDGKERCDRPRILQDSFPKCAGCHPAGFRSQRRRGHRCVVRILEAVGVRRGAWRDGRRVLLADVFSSALVARG